MSLHKDYHNYDKILKTILIDNFQIYIYVNKQFSFAFCITSSEQIPNAIILPFR